MVEALSRLPHGLVLIGGPAGSGKSTTLAALIDLINQRDARHIITIEDPVEYEHVHFRSLIEQVEVGVDAPDFPTALRAALRQAPDIIVVGEMRDPETMRIAVAAAETGHLVLSTLHTTDVANTVSRISDSFPLERQNTIRQELAMALAAVLTQVLLPTKNGGRMPAAELLMLGYGADSTFAAIRCSTCIRRSRLQGTKDRSVWRSRWCSWSNMVTSIAKTRWSVPITPTTSTV